MDERFAQPDGVTTELRGFSVSAVMAWAAPTLLVAASLAVFHASKVAVTAAGRVDVSPFYFVLASFVVAIAASSVRYTVVSAPARIILRGIAVMVLVQVLFEAFGAVYGAPNLLFADGPDLLFFRYGAVLAIVAGVLAWFRPSFALPLFFHYVLFRARISINAGIPVVKTDYLSMVDVALFCAVSILCVVALTQAKLLARAPAMVRERLGDVAALRSRTWLLVWGVAVGAHLGNYYHSGVAKLQAGGPEPWTWMLHNPTETAIVIGLERGDNPLAGFPLVLGAVWATIQFATPFINPFILGLQVLSPLAAINRRVLLAFTVLFDLFHVIVYFTLGAIFQFWVVVNVLVFASAVALPRNGFNNAVRVAIVVFTIFGQNLFYTSHLGWLDGAKLASPKVYAETRDHRLVEAPGVYFGIFSYTLAQGQMYIPEDYFPMRVGGNTKNLADWRDASVCGLKILHRQNTEVSLAAVESLVRNADGFMRRNPTVKAYNLYYVYPHHMMPNPYMFREFNRLKMEDIVGYRYAVDSVCLGLRDGRLVRDVRKHWETPIALNPG
jgi:hypothetical protein